MASDHARSQSPVPEPAARGAWATRSRAGDAACSPRPSWPGSGSLPSPALKGGARRALGGPARARAAGGEPRPRSMRSSPTSTARSASARGDKTRRTRSDRGPEDRQDVGDLPDRASRRARPRLRGHRADAQARRRAQGAVDGPGPARDGPLPRLRAPRVRHQPAACRRGSRRWSPTRSSRRSATCNMEGDIRGLLRPLPAPSGAGRYRRQPGRRDRGSADAVGHVPAAAPVRGRVPRTGGARRSVTDPRFADTATFFGRELPGDLREASTQTAAKLDAPRNKILRS